MASFTSLNHHRRSWRSIKKHHDPTRSQKNTNLSSPSGSSMSHWPPFEKTLRGMLRWKPPFAMYIKRPCMVQTIQTTTTNHRPAAKENTATVCMEVPISSKGFFQTCNECRPVSYNQENRLIWARKIMQQNRCHLSDLTSRRTGTSTCGTNTSGQGQGWQRHATRNDMLMGQ